MDQKRQPRRRADAWLLFAGELKLVHIPSVEEKQLRDLVRCREDMRVD